MLLDELQDATPLFGLTADAGPADSSLYQCDMVTDGTSRILSIWCEQHQRSRYGASLWPCVIAGRDNSLRHDAFTASLNALPAVNLTAFAAGIWISAPVAGLRPMRAARAPVENEPKPISWTESPL
jgi:hypothetical protein